MKKDMIRKKIAICWGIVLPFFSYAIFFVKHYSVDSFSVFSATDSKVHFENARYLSWLLDIIMRRAGINPIVDQFWFVLFLSASLGICIIILSLTASRFLVRANWKDYLFASLICSASFVNVFYSEWYIYAEIDIYYGLSVLLAILAVFFSVREASFIRRRFLPFFLLLCSLFFYQATMAIYVIWVITFEFLAFIETGKIRRFFSGFVSALLIGGSTSVICIISSLQSRGEVTGRGASLSFEGISNALAQIIRQQKPLWGSAFHLMPRFWLFTLTCIILIISLYGALRKGFLVAFIFLMVEAVNYFVIFAPHFVTSNFWMAPRTIVGWFSWISGTGLIAWVLFRKEQVGNGFQVPLLFLAFLVVSINQIVLIGKDQIRENQMESQEAAIIQGLIETYEKESGNTIDSVAVMRDSDPTFHSLNLRYWYMDINARCFLVDWGDVNALNFYNGTDYIKVPFDRRGLSLQWSLKNWDEFNAEEQCVCEGNTLYWCIY